MPNNERLLTAKEYEALYYEHGNKEDFQLIVRKAQDTKTASLVRKEVLEEIERDIQRVSAGTSIALGADVVIIPLVSWQALKGKEG